MTDCERLSERMPQVAHEGGGWSAEESAHLARCPECSAEWELVCTARGLGTRAPAVDADAVATALLGRLTAERSRARRSRWVWVAGSAAAAAAIAFAATGVRESPETPAPQVAIEAEPLVPLPELEGLETAQLDTLLQALDGSFAGAAPSDSSALGDDVDAELEWILATWEG